MSGVSDSPPDLDRLQEMLGTEWVLTDWQREIITRWCDAQMAGESSTVAVSPRGAVVTDQTKRGTRLPEDWQPSDKMQSELVAQYPGVNFAMILDEFRDYWCAVPGQRGLKLSWERTFRNRVREVAHKPQYRLRNAPRTEPSTVDAKALEYLQ